jgi:hypothetical protein
MDLFKYGRLTGHLDLVSGERINGYSSITWIERFRDASEFTLEAQADTNLQAFLPLGTLISHTNTREIMIVENHEIISPEDAPPTLKITGRSFETFLENRIVGSNVNWNLWNRTEYKNNWFPVWARAKELVREHTYEQVLLDYDDSLRNLNIELAPDVYSVNTTVPLDEDIFEKQPLYQAFINLLTAADLGVSSMRPLGDNLRDPYSSVSEHNPNGLTLMIRRGTDRSSQVGFSHLAGEIKSANYLWSLKSLKTACIVESNYLQVRVVNPGLNYNRRVMYLPAKDLDEAYEVIPTGSANNAIRAAMRRRGQLALANQKRVAISSVQLDPGKLRFHYRTDYFLGDYVGVSGEYETSSKMRVIEHVEIEDQNGYTSYPTLQDPEGDS